MEYKQELDSLIQVVVQENASDLHLSAGRKPAIRVSGNLIPLAKKEALTNEDARGFINEMLDEKSKAAFDSGVEVDFSYASSDGTIRFRGNAYVHSGKVSVALRSIQQVKTLEELRLPPMLAEFARKKQGFFLIVGPVGVGKSTTIAALIDLINKERTEHIVTIEDPVEYLFEEKNSIIDQREVGLDTEDFHSGLRSSFRQDVNVVMVGEMRDPETIATAVTAAETGHLVLSTLHTNNAAQTIDRIIDSFASSQQDQIRTQLAGSLLGIFSQRLLPRTAGGLVPAYELLINNNAVANLIREGRTHEIGTVIETGREDGMIDMNHSLAELVQAQEITIEEAYRYSMNPKGLEQLM